jgi:predicted dehydrogenase
MKKFAVCGVSNRGIHGYIKPMSTTFTEVAGIVALLDTDPVRFRVCAESVPGIDGIPTYGESEFDRMIDETQPDVVLVTSVDATHARYILKALERDVNVIVEKPMVTTGEDCRRVMNAEAASSASVTVTFNARYPAAHQKIKELIVSGAVGRVTSARLNWDIDTYHGASYFKRWNREREKSGGLSIHKATHHFDLVGWLIDQAPVEAFAYGALNYYGADGEMNPRKVDGRHCGDCPDIEDCRYVMRWSTRSRNVAVADDHLGTVRGGNTYTGYRPDACIFDSTIDIEDSYAATVQYDRGAFLSYAADFSAPYEGHHLVVSGTRGRIEYQTYHAPNRTPFATPAVEHVDYFPIFGGRERITVVTRSGGHGGADAELLEDLILGVDEHRPFAILAGSDEGARAVALGEAVWRSARENRPVRIPDLIG